MIDSLMHVVTNVQAFRPVGEVMYFTAEDWETFDKAVLEASRPRLNVFLTLEDLGCGERSEPSTKMFIERCDDKYPPLCTYHRCSFGNRAVTADRARGVPIDTSCVCISTMKVAERVERLLLGVDPNYEGHSLYGLCNHPNRLTFSIPKPDSPDKLQDALSKAKTMLLEKGIEDKFLVILSPEWKVSPDEMCEKNAFKKCIVSEHLPPWTIVLVELSPETITVYTELDITPIVWRATKDEIEMVVFCRKIPLLRSRCGVLVISAD